MIERAVPVLVLAAGLSACVSERVVLLPSPDGERTALVVRANDAEWVLGEPYAATRRILGQPDTYRASATEVERRFGDALAARPPRPVRYTLYFETGGNTLTAESRAVFAQILSAIATRPASEVRVVGHTDRVGGLEDNDRLSLSRAEGIRDELIRAGVGPEKLEAVGRGEREPLVPTADEVDEPRNRRVEISVR